jgi:hypothetical protein
MGHKLSNGAVGRHYSAHMLKQHERAALEIGDGPPPKEDHVQVLELIISQGATSMRRGAFKITPDLTLKAMEQLYKLTQGNAQQAWMDAMGEAIAGLVQPDPAEAEVDAPA